MGGGETQEGKYGEKCVFRYILNKGPFGTLTREVGGEGRGMGSISVLDSHGRIKGLGERWVMEMPCAAPENRLWLTES